MTYSAGAITVQSDLTILLNHAHPDAAVAREKLNAWTELLHKAGTIHLYKLSALSLWNAVSMGENERDMLEWMKRNSTNGLPLKAEAMIRAWLNRFGKVVLYYDKERLILAFDSSLLHTGPLMSLVHKWAVSSINECRFVVNAEDRGLIKQELTRSGFPVIDQAGYIAGEDLPVQLRTTTRSGVSFRLRSYQQEALARWKHQTELLCGSGVAVLPCGAGKTVVGIAALASLRKAALILTSSSTSVQQWKQELLDKTTLTEQDIGVYCGRSKQVRPITIATYNILTHRSSKTADFAHMQLFTEREWGIIIYDEVHLLPAPVFRMTADIQATRRLGLTATLIREDGCAEDVYSLIGPKLYDMNWKNAEQQQVIAEVHCTEIRVPLDKAVQMKYEKAGAREKLRIASENAEKLTVVRQLLEKHADKQTLVIGQYLSQLSEAAQLLQAPLLTGEVSHEKRQKIFDQFKSGAIRVLVLSKIANLAVDLPDASVAIQLSGSFGSRQEEAQRIGRLLRPKQGTNEAWFYTLVTDRTKETEFAMKRQLFMLEQGYQYERVELKEKV